MRPCPCVCLSVPLHRSPVSPHLTTSLPSACTSTPPRSLNPSPAVPTPTLAARISSDLAEGNG
ncbi:MAG: hypothetical protein ACKERG_00170 [Candidatus Hodgkinia cicadicola]